MNDDARRRPTMRGCAPRIVGLLACCALALQATPAVAQIEGSAAVPIRTSGDRVRPTPGKSAGTASLLSAVGLIAPVVAGGVLASHSAGTHQAEIGATFIGSGLLLGPATGYAYGGCGSRGLIGVGLRAGTAALALGIATLTPTHYDEPDSDLLVAGAGLLLIGAEGLYDCFVVGSCVRDRSRSRRTVGVRMAPGPDPRAFTVALQVSY